MRRPRCLGLVVTWFACHETPPEPAVETPEAIEEKIPVGTMDVAPTLLAAAGQPIPESFDGLPLLPAPAARPLLFQEDLHGRFRGVLWQGWKLVIDDVGPHLFHLETDAIEQQDLAGGGLPEEQTLLAIALAQWPEIAEWSR